MDPPTGVLSEQEDEEGAPTSEPLITKQKLAIHCDDCGNVFNSRRTYFRHKQVGCDVHRVDRRWAGNRVDGAPGGHYDPHAHAHHDTAPFPPFHRLDGRPSSLPPATNAMRVDSVGGLQPNHSCPSGDSPPHSPPTSVEDAGGSGEQGFRVSMRDGGMYDELFMPESAHGLFEEDASSEGSESEANSLNSAGEEAEEMLQQDVVGSSARAAYGTSDACKRRTSQWYVDRGKDPLYEGSALTVEQQCYALLKSKLEHHLTDKYFDELCNFLASVLLPQPNKQPPSLYLVKKVCKVGDVHDYEKHVCENDCMRFDDIPLARYAERADEKCTNPKCNMPRFKLSGAGGNLLVPRKVFWEIGVDEAIKSMFGDPEWNSLRGRNRGGAPLDFYNSPEAKRLNGATGGALLHPDNSAYELGMDFFQCFDFKQHSVGLLGMRCVFSLPLISLRA